MQNLTSTEGSQVHYNYSHVADMTFQQQTMDADTAGPVILETLTNACSQDPAVLAPAEYQLQQWQTQPGFYTILSVCIV